MRDFNAVKFGLDIPDDFALDVFSRLIGGLCFELDKIPTIDDIKIEGRTPFAVIGERDESEYIITFKEQSCNFKSFLEIKDNSFRGSSANAWFEAQLKGFKLQMSNNDNPELLVEISSFEHYDLLLDLVRNFNAKIIEKVMQKREGAAPEVEIEVNQRDEFQAETPSSEESSSDLNVLIGSLTIKNCLGFELYQLLENKLMDFLAAIGINQHHLLKDQTKYDENGWYQKSFTSRLLKLEMELKLDRDSGHKNAELKISIQPLFPHNYLPERVELRAFNSNPGKYEVNTIELHTEEKFVSNDLSKKLEGDLKTFFMIAAL